MELGTRTMTLSKGLSTGWVWALLLMGLGGIVPLTDQQSPASGAVGVEVGEIDLRQLPLLRLEMRLQGADGAPVHGVGREDLRVEFDGKTADSVRLDALGFNGSEVSVVIAVDLSTSMRPVMDEVREGLLQLIDRTPDGAEVGLVTFATSANRVAELAVGGSRLQGRIQGMEAQGYTAMRDAVELGLVMLNLTTRPHQHLILITDGVDNRSSITPDDLLSGVRESSAQIHVLAIGEELDGPFLRELSHVSGGSYMDVVGRPLTSTDVRRLATELATANLESRYAVEIEVDSLAMDRWGTLRLVIQPPGFSPSTFERPLFLSPRPSWGEGVGDGNTTRPRVSRDRPIWVMVLVGVAFLLLVSGSFLVFSQRRRPA